MVTLEQIREAEARATERISKVVTAREAYFDGKEVVLSLSNGKRFAFDPHRVQGLENAIDAHLYNIELTPLRDGLYFPELDVDLSIPDLVEGRYGSDAWMRSHSK